MKRILLMVFRNLLLVPYAWIRLCYVAAHAGKYTKEERYRLLQYIDRHANRGGRILIDVHGAENIPEKDGFIFFPNHQGLYDVLAIVEACPRPFSVVMKKEVANIPFLKQVFACMGAQALDRADVRQGLKVIAQVVEEVKKYFPRKVFKTVIPRTVRLSEAPGFGQPALYYDKSSRGAKAYQELAGEILKNNR